MPELDPDALIITDERLRALLTVLLGKWSVPEAQPLLLQIQRRIQEAVGQRLSDAGQINAQAYFALLDKARTIFTLQIGPAIQESLSRAFDALAADEVLREVPRPKRKRRHGKAVQHPAIALWLRSIDLIQVILVGDASKLSKSFVASLYYQKCDPAKLGPIDEAWSRYKKLSQTHRDGRLRAYDGLLKGNEINFDELVSAAKDLLVWWVTFEDIALDERLLPLARSLTADQERE